MKRMFCISEPSFAFICACPALQLACPRIRQAGACQASKCDNPVVRNTTKVEILIARATLALIQQNSHLEVLESVLLLPNRSAGGRCTCVSRPAVSHLHL